VEDRVKCALRRCRISSRTLAEVSFRSPSNATKVSFCCVSVGFDICLFGVRVDRGKAMGDVMLHFIGEAAH
jgi:hypothetical protein